jgi:methyl-accepting chemotaxis protein-1 (serine sensor receptor)
MKLVDLKISLRLGLLGAVFLLAMLVLNMSAWHALAQAGARANDGLARMHALAQAADTARAAQVAFKIQVQEWKDILLRGSDPAAFDKYSKAFAASHDGVMADLDKLSGQLTKLGLPVGQVADTQSALRELQQSYLAALRTFEPANADSYKQVDAQVKGKDREPTQQIEALVGMIQQKAGQALDSIGQENAAAERSEHVWLMGLLVATLLGAGALTVWLARSITAPVNEAVEIAGAVAGGDLTHPIVVDRKDEIGVLLGSLKHMQDNLAGIVGRVRSGAETITVAAGEIAQGNQNLASRTEEQASSVQETATSMQELTTMVHNSRQEAEQAMRLATEASGIAARGGRTVAEVVATMGEIDVASRKIVDIIGVIDGIAFQTNTWR